MNVSEFDYDLPPDRIAQRPLAERDASRMLLLDRTTGAWEDRWFRELPDLLRGDELIVINNARVLPARLFGRREGFTLKSSGARIPPATNSCIRPSKCFSSAKSHRIRGRRS